MLSYDRKLDHLYDRENGDEYYQYVSKVTLTLSEVYPVGQITLEFNMKNKDTSDQLKKFLNKEIDRIDLNGSEGDVTINLDLVKKEFVFSVGYNESSVYFSFSLAYDVCQGAFKALALDLEKYPHRY